MRGFKFGIKHTDDYKIAMRSKNRTMLPQKRQSEEIIPKRHGSIKFDNGYADRIIEVECYFLENGYENRRQIIRDIALWLATSGQLIFDDEPEKYYDAEIISNVGVSIDAAFDTFSLNFICKPFAKSTYLNEDIVLDSDIVLYSNVPLGYDLINNFYVTGNRNGIVNNLGTFEAELFFEITGTATSLTLATDSDSFTIKNITQKTYIDSENMRVYTIDVPVKKVNKLADFTGTFPKLKPGENNIAVSGVNLNCNIFFNYRNTYL